MSTPIRVLVIAGDRLARAGLAATLESEGFDVVGRIDPFDASSGFRDLPMLEGTSAYHADAIAADFGGPGAYGAATAERLGTLLEALVSGFEGGDPDSVDSDAIEGPVLVALVDDAAQGRFARSFGAAAILDREIDPAALAAALAAAVSGLIVVSPALIYANSSFMQQSTFGDTALSDWAYGEETFGDGEVVDRTYGGPYDTLTPRESEVLNLLADGRSNRQIAAALSISPHTVKDHVDAILSKLGAASRTEAAVRAARLGLITL